MGHAAQLKCARILLEASFARVMAEVWQEFPESKWIGTVLPNYLQVSKSKKYKQFFIKVNQYILEDFKVNAFRSLKKNVQTMKNFRKATKSRFLEKVFKNFRSAIMSQNLMQRYFERSDQVRRVRFLKEVMWGLRWQTQQALRQK